MLKPLDERGAAAGRGGRPRRLSPTLPAVELSYGRKRALEIATTLALDPEMMLLDEPMAGMGREDVERIEALIRKVSQNRTILMVEHNLSVVASLSDRITVLARGQVLAEGDYATVSKDPRVVEAYIGREAAMLTEAAPSAAAPRPAPRRCSRCASSRPGTANRMSCTASISTSRRARW